MRVETVWEYLEELPEQTAAWCEWKNHLGQWEKFSVFYNNYLQVEMLRRLRAMPDPEGAEAEKLREVVVLTINGIAAGLRSTG